MKINFYVNAKFRKIMRKIEILNLKLFDRIYVCVKSMVKNWCDILIIHKK